MIRKQCKRCGKRGGHVPGCGKAPRHPAPTAESAPHYVTCRRCGHPWGDPQTGYCADCTAFRGRVEALAARVNAGAGEEPGIRRAIYHGPGIV